MAAPHRVEHRRWRGARASRDLPPDRAMRLYGLLRARVAESGPLTYAQVAELAGITVATASDYVLMLESRGLVVVQTSESKGHGRRPENVVSLGPMGRVTDVLAATWLGDDASLHRAIDAIEDGDVPDGLLALLRRWASDNGPELACELCPRIGLESDAWTQDEAVVCPECRERDREAACAR